MALACRYSLQHGPAEGKKAEQVTLGSNRERPVGFLRTHQGPPGKHAQVQTENTGNNTFGLTIERGSRRHDKLARSHEQRESGCEEATEGPRRSSMGGLCRVPGPRLPYVDCFPHGVLQRLPGYTRNGIKSKSHAVPHRWYPAAKRVAGRPARRKPPSTPI